MKLKSTFCFLLMNVLFSMLAFGAPNPGDYRSNPSTFNAANNHFYGLWSSPSTWEVFDGTSWVAASTAPSSTDGVITIQNGDSVILSTSTTIDQVFVESNGIFGIFNLSGTVTATLNNDTGDDIVVDGKIYVASNGTLTGTGTLQINSAGFFIFRNGGTLGVNTTNDGYSSTNLVNINNSVTFTNNNVLEWLGNAINLTAVTIINNGSWNITSSGTQSLGGSGTVTNSAGAFIYNQNPGAVTNFNSPVVFNNSGLIKGTGTYFFNASTNSGMISPGNSSAASMTVNPSLVSGKNPQINLEIRSTGAVAGVNYDQLAFNTAIATNLTSASLVIGDFSNTDPIGTVYTIITSPSGTITGPFASVTIPPTLGNLVYNSNSVTVQRISSSLPLLWGEFNVTVGTNKINLQWTTLQEINTSHFDIEFASDGTHFESIGTLPAAGNSAQKNTYNFVHNYPAAKATLYYRIKQIDIDGRFTYSPMRFVRFENGHPLTVVAYPNPVRGSLNISVQQDDVKIVLMDIKGRQFISLDVNKGFHSINMSNYPSGVYELGVYHKGEKIESFKVLKVLN